MECVGHEEGDDVCVSVYVCPYAVTIYASLVMVKNTYVVMMRSTNEWLRFILFFY